MYLFTVLIQQESKKCLYNATKEFRFQEILFKIFELSINQK